nr:hypothetical protein [Candidatus Sigynarchaeota archaeon]
MVSVELLVDDVRTWNKNADVLDFTAKIQVIVKGNMLPAKYFQAGLEVNLYETTFELLDLLGNLVKVFKVKKGANDSVFQAELCYTGNFLMVQAVDGMATKVAVRFNPATVDDEALLAGSPDFQEQSTFSGLATEIVQFAISVYEAMVDFNPALEPSLVDLQTTIFDYQDQLDKDFGIKVLPPAEEK